MGPEERRVRDGAVEEMVGRVTRGVMPEGDIEGSKVGNSTLVGAGVSSIGSTLLCEVLGIG